MKTVAENLPNCAKTEQSLGVKVGCDAFELFAVLLLPSRSIQSHISFLTPSPPPGAQPQTPPPTLIFPATPPPSFLESPLLSNPSLTPSSYLSLSSI